jgi:uncharacterized protein
VILCDTGVLLCLVDRNQFSHIAYTRYVQRSKEPMITTWACLAEAMHLALSRGGWRMQKQLSTFLLYGPLTIYDIQPDDYERLFALMEQYRDRPMDLADATLVLVAEKVGERRILTTDSDFLFYRIAGKESFEIVEA